MSSQCHLVSLDWELVGRTPWSARVPQDPLFCNELSFIESQRADVGVGRGPGGPPHKSSQAAKIFGFSSSGSKETDG
jgi:hypothetical protein